MAACHGSIRKGPGRGRGRRSSSRARRPSSKGQQQQQQQQQRQQEQECAESKDLPPNHSNRPLNPHPNAHLLQPQPTQLQPLQQQQQQQQQQQPPLPPQKQQSNLPRKSNKQPASAVAVGGPSNLPAQNDTNSVHAENGAAPSKRLKTGGKAQQQGAARDATPARAAPAAAAAAAAAEIAALVGGLNGHSREGQISIARPDGSLSCRRESAAGAEGVSVSPAQAASSARQAAAAAAARTGTPARGGGGGAKGEGSDTKAGGVTPSRLGAENRAAGSAGAADAPTSRDPKASSVRRQRGSGGSSHHPASSSLSKPVYLVSQACKVLCGLP